MTTTPLNLYKTYFSATVGRFYTSEQRAKLFSLFLAGEGIEPSGREYDKLARAVQAVEAQNITSYTDSKNFKLMRDMLNRDDLISTAAAALVSVYRDFERNNGTRGHASYLEWVISLRTAVPKSEDERLELAYFEYSSGNIFDAISELKALVNGGNLTAIRHLASIYRQEKLPEEAFYYLSLLSSIYRQELKIGVPPFIDKYIAEAKRSIDKERAEAISEDIASLTSFLITKCASHGGIGFSDATQAKRRFTYEYK